MVKAPKLPPITMQTSQRGIRKYSVCGCRILPSYELLGLELWQWVFLLGLGIAAYLIAFLPTWGLGMLLRRKGGMLSQEVARFISGPLRLLIVLLLLREWIDVIHPSVTARALMRGKTLLLIAATWAAMRIIDLLRKYMTGRLRYSQREQVIVLLRPSANAIKTLLILIIFMIWLDKTCPGRRGIDLGVRIQHFL